MSSSGFILAQERGYFKEQGLDVELNDFPSSGAPMTVLLSKGELDVGAGTITSGLLNAIANGNKIKLVAEKGHKEEGVDNFAVLVRADHIESGRFKTLKDLKGFKMGMTALGGNSIEQLQEQMLAKAGLLPTDVEMVKLSYSEMNVALKSKRIDATLQIEPFSTMALLDGIVKKVGDTSELKGYLLTAAVFYSPKFMETRPLDAKKFMIAYLKGARDYNLAFREGKNKAAVVADLKKYIKVEKAEVWNQMKPANISNDGLFNTNTLAENIKWYQEKNYVPKSPSIDQVVDFQFVKAAAAELDVKAKFVKKK